MPVVRDFFGYLWTLFCLVCVAVTALSIYDWVCDNLDVVRLAEEEACADEADGCRAQVTLLMRTPITQSFELATARRPRIHVRCARAWVLAGDYRCTALEAAPVALTAAPTASARAVPGPARRASSVPSTTRQP
jgi:hypothetical protein